MVALLVALVVVIALAVELHVVRRGTLREPEVTPGLLPMRAPAPPESVFLTRGHTWVRMTTEGTLRVGIDDLIAQALGEVESVWVPQPGTEVRTGDALMRMRVGGRELTVGSPGDGVVESFNVQAVSAPWAIAQDPYRSGWVVSLRPRDYEAMIAPLRMGATAAAYLRNEMARLVELLTTPVQVGGAPVLADGALPARGAAARLDDTAWASFEKAFVRAR